MEHWLRILPWKEDKNGTRMWLRRQLRPWILWYLFVDCGLTLGWRAQHGPGACRGGVKSMGLGDLPNVLLLSHLLFLPSLLPFLLRFCFCLFFLHSDSSPTVHWLQTNQRLCALVDLPGWWLLPSSSHCICPSKGPSGSDLIWVKKKKTLLYRLWLRIC